MKETMMKQTQFEIIITPTMKGYAPRDQWQRYPAERVPELFAAMKDVRAYLRKRYGRSRLQPMYRDQNGGAPFQCGWVIGYRNADLSHSPVAHWLQQDWIEVRAVSTVAVA